MKNNAENAFDQPINHISEFIMRVL